VTVPVPGPLRVTVNLTAIAKFAVTD